jgi:hypothetical protein
MVAFRQFAGLSRRCIDHPGPLSLRRTWAFQVEVHIQLELHVQLIATTLSQRKRT